jgi:hypothetical protein
MILLVQEIFLENTHQPYCWVSANLCGAFWGENWTPSVGPDCLVRVSQVQLYHQSPRCMSDSAAQGRPGTRGAAQDWACASRTACHQSLLLM